MARCEDYPCCGHTPDDPCPDRDADGRIIPRCCVCQAKLKKNASSSLCASCIKRYERAEDYYDDRDSYGD